MSVCDDNCGIASSAVTRRSSSHAFVAQHPALLLNALPRIAENKDATVSSKSPYRPGLVSEQILGLPQLDRASQWVGER
jgi:hypothetical protein